MAQLTGNPIQSSYLGLIKTTDNAALSGTAKAITDGAGGATNLEMSTTSTNFVSGTVDFTGSTVSGLPAGTNTTYDLDAAQVGANVELDLNGSDATQSTVTFTAGTNITLTNDANNNLTIDAASGGGGGGFSSTKIVSTTHVQNDIIQATFQIPANTFTTGDIFNIRSMDQRAGIDATQYTAIWISDQQQTVGNTPVNTGANYNITQIQSNQIGIGQYNKNCYIDTATSTTWIDSFSNELANEFQGGANVASNNIDWTANQYIYLQLYSDASVGTYTNYYIVAKKQN